MSPARSRHYLINSTGLSKPDPTMTFGLFLFVINALMLRSSAALFVSGFCGPRSSCVVGRGRAGLST